MNKRIKKKHEFPYNSEYFIKDRTTKRYWLISILWKYRKENPDIVEIVRIITNVQYSGRRRLACAIFPMVVSDIYRIKGGMITLDDISDYYYTLCREKWSITEGLDMFLRLLQCEMSLVHDLNNTPQEYRNYIAVVCKNHIEYHKRSGLFRDLPFSRSV